MPKNFVFVNCSFGKGFNLIFQGKICRLAVQVDIFVSKPYKKDATLVPARTAALAGL